MATKTKRPPKRSKPKSSTTDGRKRDGRRKQPRPVGIQPLIHTVDPRTRTSLTRGFFVIRWIEMHCVHTDAEWRGKPFRLLPWQKRIILALFAIDPVTQLRLYRWALIGVPKKNGKTELAAALALYFLLGDGEPSPLVVCAAAADEQADLVFGAAKTMCELSPTLRMLTGGERNHGKGERWDAEILVPETGGRLVRIAANGGLGDGKNIHAVICDELHEWLTPKQRKTWTVLTNGLGARRQPMVLQITTAGHDVDGTICGQQYTHCTRVADGEVEDPTYYVYWQQAPPGAPHDDPATWAAANPSYGVTVQEAFFRDQVTKKSKAEFQRYFCNTWTTSEEIWEVAEWWGNLTDTSIELDPDRATCVGIDASRRGDATAVYAAQKQPVAYTIEAREPSHYRTIVKGRIWENPYPPQDARHATWRVNEFEVENYCRQLQEQLPAPTREVDGELIPGPAFFYDERYFNQSARSLEGDGLAMIEYPQTDQRMCPASQVVFELAKSGLLAHDGDPALGRHIRNVQIDERANRGWRISKPRGSRAHIDGGIAVAIAVREVQMEPAEEQQVNVRWF